ncbi:di-N-acetylchitobiase-like [Glandiceps talaboti]
MASPLCITSVVTCLIIIVVSTAESLATSSSCPCSDPSLCKPIQSQPEKEIFVFRTEDTWKFYDWSMVTTVAMFFDFDPELLCTAHAHKARLVLTASFPKENLTNADDRRRWIDGKVQQALDWHMDGINFDFESPLVEPERIRHLTMLVNETTHAFHQKIPGSQVTFDVAYTSSCSIESSFRCYDYKGLAEVADFLYVMGYDEQDFMNEYGQCEARANAPYDRTVKGIEDYFKLGIPPSKLVLGVPWYGYTYPCQSLSGTTCIIDNEPVWPLCSEDAGDEKHYRDVMTLFANNATTTRLWSEKYKSPYFNYVKSSDNKTRQMWYDDPESLTYKYQYAKQRGLRGVGPWNGDALDYSDNPRAREQTKAMWDALKVFLAP